MATAESVHQRQCNLFTAPSYDCNAFVTTAAKRRRKRCPLLSNHFVTESSVVAIILHTFTIGTVTASTAGLMHEPMSTCSSSSKRVSQDVLGFVQGMFPHLQHEGVPILVLCHHRRNRENRAVLLILRIIALTLRPDSSSSCHKPMWNSMRRSVNKVTSHGTTSARQPVISVSSETVGFCILIKDVRLYTLQSFNEAVCCV